MHHVNISTVLFLGFGNINDFRTALFLFFLTIYCVAVCANSLIFILIINSKILHSPMYFFLSQLSITDIMLTTDITPSLLHVITYDGSSMPFTGCLMQFYFFGLLEITESFLLTVMSYDRYLAICRPLYYNTIMNFLFCIKLITTSWLFSALVVILQASQVSQLHFCGPNIIDHFYCDFDPLLKLSCSSVFTIRLIASILGIPLFLCSFIIILLSYTFIISAVVKIRSVSGRKKAFSTCSSHFFVVTLYYGTFNAMYLLPTREKSFIMGKALSVLYTVITPFFNPIIYCMRSKDITEAYRKCTAQICK